tara:strand:+ start:236 stop:481 length:246 start_codon:yes stop_codon:yes gene_type:complete
MSYQAYNIADEIKIMNLCQDIVHLEQEIEKLRLRVGKLQDEKIFKEVQIDKIREAAWRAYHGEDSPESGTSPLPVPPPSMA